MPFSSIVIQIIAPFLNFAHASSLEVYSASQVLTSDSINEIQNFANNLPTTNIGNSGTLLDFFAPFISFLGASTLYEFGDMD